MRDVEKLPAKVSPDAEIAEITNDNTDFDATNSNKAVSEIPDAGEGIGNDVGTCATAPLQQEQIFSKATGVTVNVKEVIQTYCEQAIKIMTDNAVDHEQVRCFRSAMQDEESEFFRTMRAHIESTLNS